MRGPAAVAVEQVLGGLARLEELELWSLSSGELVGLTEVLHRASSSVAAHGLRALAEFEARGVAVEVGAASTVAWLTGSLRMGLGQAARPVALAKALVECPVTLDAVAGGAVSVEQAEVITKTLAQVASVAGDDTVAQAEVTLLRNAEEFFPARLAKIGHYLLEVLDPDGHEPSEGAPERPEPFLTLRTLADGTCEGEFRLDPVTALTFTQIVGAASAPRPSSDQGRDLPGAGRRRADGFADLIKLAAGSKARPGAGRRPSR